MNEPAKPPSTSPSRGTKSAFKQWFDKTLKRLFKLNLESSQELNQQLEYLHQSGHLNHDTLAMLNGALSINGMQVGDIMVPKSSMDCIPANANFYETLKLIHKSLHSRYPVVDDNDKPIGLLFSKDIISHTIKTTNSKVSLSQRAWTAGSLMRHVERVPENMSLSVLLRRFRSGKNHLAIAINEFGEMTGLITIEDVLEQIVGEIKDEYDVAETIWILDHGSHATVKALTPIETFNKHFDCRLESELGETIASAIIEHCDRLPKQGEVIDLADFSIKVLKVDSRRLHLLSVTQNNQQSQPTSSVEDSQNSVQQDSNQAA